MLSENDNNMVLMVDDGAHTVSDAPDINTAIKDHALGLDDWDWKALMELLHVWAERFNTVFALDIPTPAIRIDYLRRQAMGTYRPGRNGFGLKHEVSLNILHLARHPLAEHLDTLLHELIHQWQDIHGKPGKRNYHNKQFRQKAESLGLLIDERGRSLGVVPDSPFIRLLQQFNVDTTPLPLPSQQPRRRTRGQSKLKKWSCGCTNIRAATPVKARCLACGNQFVHAEPAW